MSGAGLFFAGMACGFLLAVVSLVAMLVAADIRHARRCREWQRKWGQK